MDVVISRPAEEFIRDHGATVFVHALPHRCRTGSLTLLDTTTRPPTDSSEFESFHAGDAGVRFHRGASGLPGHLTIELSGKLKRNPAAFWDGCAFKLQWVHRHRHDATLMAAANRRRTSSTT